MDAALTQMLLASAGLTALVGQRITWLERPQASALPAVTLQVISRVPFDSDEGDSGLYETRVQVDCWAAQALAAKNVATQIKTLLSGKSASVPGIDFQGIWTEGESDFSDRTAGEAVIYRVSLDFIIHHYQ